MPVTTVSEWWKNLPDAWKTVVVIVSGVCLVIGTYRSVDSYVAKQQDFVAHKSKNKVDFAEMSKAFVKSAIRQDIRWNSKEIYELEKHLREYPNDEIARKRLSELKEEKIVLERELVITTIEVIPKNPPDPAPVKLK